MKPAKAGGETVVAPRPGRFLLLPGGAMMPTNCASGRRLTREFCDNHEIILLSERIVPRGYRAEDDPKVRYFWFAVLHEVAHAYCDHEAPNAISAAGNAAQENDADELAFAWFNKYLKSKKQPEFTSAELERAKAASQAEWETAFGKQQARGAGPVIARYCTNFAI